MLIVYTSPGGGWEPVTYMVSLAAELFEAEVLILDGKMPNRLQQLEYLLLKRQKNVGSEFCLLICPTPASENYQQALARLDWRWRFATIATLLDESPRRLQDELQLLNQKIQQVPC